MQKILEHLYVGTVEDVGLAKERKFSILGAAKDPFHRRHARLQGNIEEGYLCRAMPSYEPEYLYAERDHALYLNLIDARDEKYIPDEIINKALDFIDKEISDGKDVLIACNKGESRSPSIALMWMIKNGFWLNKRIENYVNYVINDFKEYYCPTYNPSAGMFLYVVKFFNNYMNGVN